MVFIENKVSCVFYFSPHSCFPAVSPQHESSPSWWAHHSRKQINMASYHVDFIVPHLDSSIPSLFPYQLYNHYYIYYFNCTIYIAHTFLFPARRPLQYSLLRDIDLHHHKSRFVIYYLRPHYTLLHIYHYY